RVQARRLLSGTLSIRHRFLPRARLVEVVGQVRQVGGGGLQGRYIETLHCVSNTAVQSLALAYQQVGIDSLTCQRVAEGELLRRFLNDQLGSDQLLNELEQLLFVMLREFLQEGKVET